MTNNKIICFREMLWDDFPMHKVVGISNPYASVNESLQLVSTIVIHILLKALVKI
jgi:hypothetical protein